MVQIHWSPQGARGPSHSERVLMPILASAALGQNVLVVTLRPGADVWWTIHAERYDLSITVLSLGLPLGAWPTPWLVSLRLAEAVWRAFQFDVVVLYGARAALEMGDITPETLLAYCRLIARHTQLFLI
ncbi:MAG: hypothetical protein J7M34_12755 [Anaerolineae bacterium]|nr:hypothetical protein [Anaerolineae bacterium]